MNLHNESKCIVACTVVQMWIVQVNSFFVLLKLLKSSHVSKGKVIEQRYVCTFTLCCSFWHFTKTQKTFKSWFGLRSWARTISELSRWPVNYMCKVITTQMLNSKNASFYAYSTKWLRKWFTMSFEYSSLILISAKCDKSSVNALC